MFFYDHQCCMKKHGMTNDIPNIPSDEEDEVGLDDGARQGDGSEARGGSATTNRED